ncbi:4-hydroxybenzoate polyprenyltransferase [Rhodopirellula islandica]|uniref:4-hydroxybenzoate polyprenyltransferase n=1 Tax=Rhodopirellula islandica TaxID=595434 RepID=A0A0J1B7T4_RHOIS|nr:UbiA-like polyprenyltransferase [Rhodopirellula islandica]KLU02792.1 4-hydroxybenzoate polyprenyltransferase [Rhodopirellula islandica]
MAKLNDWLGLIRFSHTIFALPFAILAAFLAWATPLPTATTIPASPTLDSSGELPGAADALLYPHVRLRDILGILLCMVLARSAAMAFNRWVDRRIDAANPRTATRHIPAGVLSAPAVLAFTILCGLGFVAATLLFLPNRLPLFASLPVLLFLCGYSLAKRFTSSAHLWLGVALSLSPLCVWAAIRGEIVLQFPTDFWVPGWLAVAVAFWVAGFDIIYSCQDAAFDSAEGLHSVPSRRGVSGALRVAAASHVAMILALGLLAWTGGSSGLGGIFIVAVVLTAALVVYQHRLVSPNDLSRVNQAFFHTNAIVSLILMAAGVIDCVV